MGDAFSHWLESVTVPVQDAASRMARSAAELAVTAVFGLVGLGFLLAALAIWLARLWGPLIAMVAMAGLFFVLALAVFAIWNAGQAAERRKTEQAAREKAERARSASALGGSWINTAMTLWPLLSMAAKRRRQVKDQRELNELRRQVARDGGPAGGSVADEADGSSRQAERSANRVTGGSRQPARGSTQAVGPWTVIAVAVTGGIIASLALRRRRR